ncbi:MAG: histidine triad nucleotide-binding protein [Desulfitobacteriaceae bacterium]|nr:histidine triad nucleotide-binding protein [Desulfitobacteriaceae bacterium]MDD4346003.1 histidine triad nucleotide-binding protein [Desulfitobacteriaceae bacterium]MDD4400368.1 histidine triad nucleotide-binding protein [Desulfitobacteriaceae bacterium]
MTDCLFCKIINKEIPSEIIYEDQAVLCFKDINPVAPVHLLIIPKKHLRDLNSAEQADQSLLGRILLIMPKLAVEVGIAQSGYRVVANNGPDAGQIVEHLHFHLIGGQMSADFA